MGRDRDPFDRTMEALRGRLQAAGPLQGAAVAINSLATALGVSQTPVREVLARLAGEGLIVRTASGYAGVVHDAASLAELYDLARILLTAAARRVAWPLIAAADASAEHLLDQVAEAAGSRALAEAHARVRAQLAPFAPAERQVLGAEIRERASLAAGLADGSGAFAKAAQRYYARRVDRSGQILAAAVLAKS